MIGQSVYPKREIRPTVSASVKKPAADHSLREYKEKVCKSQVTSKYITRKSEKTAAPKNVFCVVRGTSATSTLVIIHSLWIKLWTIVEIACKVLFFSSLL
jgi:hypothetical protein